MKKQKKKKRERERERKRKKERERKRGKDSSGDNKLSKEKVWGSFRLEFHPAQWSLFLENENNS